MAKKPKIKITVGQIVELREKKYRHCVHRGIVTESFPDLVQYFGVDHNETLGYHEIDLIEVDVKVIDRERLKFSVDQELKSLEAKKLQAEVKYKALESDFEELRRNCEKHIR